MAMARLLVSFGASEAWDIIGNKASMTSQYEELRGILGCIDDGVRDRFFELIGFRNSADRKAERFIVRIEDIKAVDIQET